MSHAREDDANVWRAELGLEPHSERCRSRVGGAAVARGRRDQRPRVDIACGGVGCAALVVARQRQQELRVLFVDVAVLGHAAADLVRGPRAARGRPRAFVRPSAAHDTFDVTHGAGVKETNPQNARCGGAPALARGRAVECDAAAAAAHVLAAVHHARGLVARRAALLALRRERVDVPGSRTLLHRLPSGWSPLFELGGR